MEQNWVKIRKKIIITKLTFRLEQIISMSIIRYG